MFSESIKTKTKNILTFKQFFILNNCKSIFYNFFFLLAIVTILILYPEKLILRFKFVKKLISSKFEIHFFYKKLQSNLLIIHPYK